MSDAPLSQAQLRLVQLVCISFAVPSFALGGWIVSNPSGFWSLVGEGGAPFVQAIYGGAILGEGVMFALGARWPARYLVFFQYLVVYKTLACLAGAAVLLGMQAPPVGGWWVIAAWAFPAVVAILVFPWGRWPQLAAAITEEIG